MISNLLHLVGLRPRVYYTLTNFRGGGQRPLPPYNTSMITALKSDSLKFTCIAFALGLHLHGRPNIHVGLK